MQDNYLSSFTPSLMSPKILEAIFVQREKLVKDLIAGVRESATTQNKHYRLLVGMRGIGKTHTIALLYHRLKNEADLQDKLLIAWLKEEEWGVSTWLDLQIRIFQALADSYPEAYQDQLATNVEALYQLSPQEATARGEIILKEFILNLKGAPSDKNTASLRAASPLGHINQRTLLILTENLDQIFKGLGDIGQKKFRAYLQNNSLITIVATCQNLSRDLTSKKRAFYGFFNSNNLDKLSLEEATQLLTKIAELQADQELDKYIQSSTGKDRIKAIHHLAGGNHRVYIIFSQFLTRDSLDDLVKPVMQTLDELTPYYQARMQWLSPQQRKIIELLCDRRHAIPVKEIAQRCFISHQTTSSQLKDLLTKGYVVKETQGRESFYELQEPLMRICLEVKKQRGEPIKLFIDFLRIWYTNEELENRLKKLPQNCIEREYIKKALTLKTFTSENTYNQSEEFFSLLDIGIKSYQEENYKKSIKYLNKAISINSNIDYVWGIYGNALDSIGQYRKAIQSYEQAIKINPDNCLAWVNMGISLFNLGKHKEAIKSCIKATEINPKEFVIWYNYAAILFNLGQYEEAVKLYNKALDINPNDLITWFNIADVFVQLHKYKKAIEAYERIIKIAPNNHLALLNHGNILFDIGEYNKAIESYNEAIKIDSKADFIWLSRGHALFNITRYEEAIESYDKVIEIDAENDSAWVHRGDSFVELSKYKEALASFDKAISINSSNSLAWSNRSTILSKLNNNEEAIKSLDKAIEIDNENAFLSFNLGKYLLDTKCWNSGFDSIENALRTLHDEKICIDSTIGIIQIISEIKRNYKSAWKSYLQTLIQLYSRYKVVSTIDKGIIKNIPNLLSEMVSNKAARTWLEVWQEVAGDKPELEIALRWLKTAVEYKETKGDSKVLLQLPKEERDLFITLLEDTEK